MIVRSESVLFGKLESVIATIYGQNQKTKIFGMIDLSVYHLFIVEPPLRVELSYQDYNSRASPIMLQRRE